MGVRLGVLWFALGVPWEHLVPTVKQSIDDYNRGKEQREDDKKHGEDGYSLVAVLACEERQSNADKGHEGEHQD